MRRFKTTAVCIFLMPLWVTALCAQSEVGAMASGSKLRELDKGPLGTATIQYDPGEADTVNAGIPGPLVGNLFNSQYGEPLASGTMYQASAWIPVNYPVRFAVFGPPTAAGSAPRIGSAVVNTYDTVARVTFSPPLSVPGSFLVGVRPNLAQGLSMATRSTHGQGFHGHYWDETVKGMGDATGIQALPGQNAVLRVRGNVAVVPVELLEFDLE